MFILFGYLYRIFLITNILKEELIKETDNRKIYEIIKKNSN